MLELRFTSWVAVYGVCYVYYAVSICLVQFVLFFDFCGLSCCCFICCISVHNFIQSQACN